MKRLTYSAALLAASLLSSCSANNEDYDATGTFEATEVTIFAEHAGQLLSLVLEEGDVLQKGQEIGVIDSSQTFLMIKQLEATKASLESQKPDTQKQIQATKDQLSQAEKDLKRFTELAADGAIGTKDVDDAQSRVDVLKSQLAAQQSTLTNNTSSLNKQIASVDAQIAQLIDQLQKHHVRAPASGTVLEKYAEQGELVTAGKPIAKTADIEKMYIRAYVTSAQLKDIKIGQSAKVLCDFGDNEKRAYDGTVTWISAVSEFTPKTILTDDERADLVYALKVSFINDGFVKIGMYGQVKF